MSSARKYTILITAGGSFLAPFMVSGLIVALPEIAAEFSMDSVEIGWLGTAFFLAASMFLIPSGRMADTSGVKRVFRAGIAVYLISALFCALAPGAHVLVASRLLTGIGASMIFGTSFALLSLSLPEAERGRAIGLNISANLAGFAMGFFAGGLLAHYLSWRWIFALTIPIDLAVLALIHFRLPGECALAECKHPDVRGMALIPIAVLLTVVGLSSLPGVQGVILLLSGLSSLALFILRELKTSCPVMDVRLFASNRPYALSNLSVLVYFTSSFATIFLFSLYMQYVRGIDDRLVGAILAASILIMALFVGYSGRLSDRKSPFRIASFGGMITATGLLVLIFIGRATPLVLVMGAMVLTLIGSAFFQPPVVRCVISSIGRDMYGVGSGLVEMMRLTGQTASMAVVIVLFSFYLGGAEINSENYGAFIQSLNVIFAVLFGLCLVSLALLVLAGREVGRCGREGRS